MADQRSQICMLPLCRLEVLDRNHKTTGIGSHLSDLIHFLNINVLNKLLRMEPTVFYIIIIIKGSFEPQCLISSTPGLNKQSECVNHLAMAGGKKYTSLLVHNLVTILLLLHM